jgi:hypothetical protein
MRRPFLFALVFVIFALLGARAQTPTTSSISDGALGKLYWGANPSTGQIWTVADLRQMASTPGDSPVRKYVNNLLSKAEKDRQAQIKIIAIPAIHLEGVLAKEPEYKESNDALNTINPLIGWAFAARLKTGPEGAVFAQLAHDGILTWIRTYRSPTGNPINESRLIPLLRAIDIFFPLFQPNEQAEAQAWLRGLILASDQFKGAHGRDERGSNNFETWRLSIRAMAAQVLGDGTETAATATLMDEHIRQNIWDDGSTFDFHRRGALHYHVYDLEAYTQSAIYVPSIYQPEDKARLETAFLFLKPYFTGEKQNIEFSNPDPSLGKPIKFDIQRKNSGQKDFLNQPWDPKGARKLLRMGRIIFPDIRSWTAGIVDEQYDPVDKLTAALQGD